MRSSLSSLGPHFDMPAILWEAALDDCDGESPSQDVTFLPEQSLEKSRIFVQKVKAHLKPTPERHRSTLRARASVHEDARGCTRSIIAPYCSSVDFAVRMSARSVACEPGLTRAQARSHAQKSTP